MSNKLINIKYIEVKSNSFSLFNFMRKSKYCKIIYDNYEKTFPLLDENNSLVLRDNIYIPFMTYSNILTIKIYRDDLLSEDDIIQEFNIDVINHKNTNNNNNKKINLYLNLLTILTIAEVNERKNELKKIRNNNDILTKRIDVYEDTIQKQKDKINIQYKQNLELLTSKTVLENDYKELEEKYLELRQQYNLIKKDNERYGREINNLTQDFTCSLNNMLNIKDNLNNLI